MPFSTPASRLLAGDSPSISLTRLPQTQNSPGNVLSAFWSRRALSPLGAAPSF